ncbi:hypothetical protein [Nonomuraea salmonea]|uniref:hypothetical protein n=1 Tax=Nonomuraea salmonea TaxID=46181 RepID=UPI0031F08DA9
MACPSPRDGARLPDGAEPSDPPEHYGEIVELRHQTNGYFRGAVARGVADGSFAKVDVKRVTRAMLSLTIDLVRWYRLDGPDSPEQLGEFYADLALKLLAPDGE